MNISIAYIFIIIIWSTTPLAIQWSSDGPGYIFSVMARMVIGLFCVLLILYFSRQVIPRHRPALYTYLAGGIGIYGAMLLVYWGAQYIPSGWISVIFGLSPIMTTLLAGLILGEKSISLLRILAQLMALVGLGIIFLSSIDLGTDSMLGLAAVLLSTATHSSSAVVIKRINANITPLACVGGSLIFVVPAYLLTWYFIDGQWPENITQKNALSILYLGIIATTGGFALYYFVLKNMSAVKVAMITLVSPVVALLLGYYFNNEILTLRTLIGTAIILLAMLFHDLIPKYRT